MSKTRVNGGNTDTLELSVREEVVAKGGDVETCDPTGRESVFECGFCGPTVKNKVQGQREWNPRGGEQRRHERPWPLHRRSSAAAATAVEGTAAATAAGRTTAVGAAAAEKAAAAAAGETAAAAAGETAAAAVAGKTAAGAAETAKGFAKGFASVKAGLVVRCEVEEQTMDLQGLEKGSLASGKAIGYLLHAPYIVDCAVAGGKGNGELLLEQNTDGADVATLEHRLELGPN
ncbi:unnamed protein product [Closterium sp. NIES-53]